MTPADLTAFRAKRMLTQAELAVRLGIDRTTVARWEAGTRQIPPFLELALTELARRMR
jgi:DNA-binding XRE family transcriptional regulator